jgi:predicted transposase YdaD
MRAPTFKQVVMESTIGAIWKKEWQSEGEVIGEARGEAKGEEKSSFRIAQNMVKMGLPIETVISATQLDPEKVKALYQQ